MITPAIDLIDKRYRHPNWTRSNPWMILIDIQRNVWLDTGYGNCAYLGQFAPPANGLPLSPGWSKREYKFTKANILKFAGC
jgi:hypothetical protein